MVNPNQLQYPTSKVDIEYTLKMKYAQALSNIEEQTMAAILVQIVCKSLGKTIC